MPTTVPGEYTGPMSRTGWLQFPVVDDYTTMRIRCLENSVPLMAVGDRIVRVRLMSVATAPFEVSVQETKTDLPLLQTVTIAGSTISVLKTAKTDMVVNAYAGARVGINGVAFAPNGTLTEVASNTATDLTCAGIGPVAPGVGVPISVWSHREPITPSGQVNPGAFVQFSFVPTLPILEFYTIFGAGFARIQLESLLRFEILGFAKNDPFYPQHIVKATYPPWNSFLP